MALVQNLLVKHPEARADKVMAIKLGSSIYHHYDTWLGQSRNVDEPFDAKVIYLLSYWKNKRNHSSMPAMVMELDEKLKNETSFNMMREQIKQRFLLK